MHDFKSVFALTWVFVIFGLHSVPQDSFAQGEVIAKKNIKTQLAPFVLEGTFVEIKVDGLKEVPSRFRISSPNSAREGMLEFFGDDLYCKYSLSLVIPQPSFFQLQTLRFQGDKADCSPGYPPSVRGVINLEQANNLGQIRLIDERLKKENALTVKSAMQK